ncbi:hypothetical protein Trco_007977 [Trichoderma cornu-damae]|uniref:Uncharacterized protein n=1 Tax=Trichoderma cornu-damae TaxID=654480 RepID=A0A9P8TSR1_9HYPO|nr:hypothetical protein Trco_007977 [Trichoderma cornu-damae]
MFSPTPGKLTTVSMSSLLRRLGSPMPESSRTSGVRSAPADTMTSRLALSVAVCPSGVRYSTPDASGVLAFPGFHRILETVPLSSLRVPSHIPDGIQRLRPDIESCRGPAVDVFVQALPQSRPGLLYAAVERSVEEVRVKADVDVAGRPVVFPLPTERIHHIGVVSLICPRVDDRHGKVGILRQTVGHEETAGPCADDDVVVGAIGRRGQ